MSAWAELSKAQRAVANYLKQGATNNTIAAALELELATVKHHVHDILKALNCKNRTEAAIRLIREEKARSE